jgi:hypothetical protein
MPQIRQVSMLLGMLILISACAGISRTESEPAVFQHDFSGTSLPWTHGNFDNEMGKFTFALFSDIANLRMSGIFDKTGQIPLNGDVLCLEECAGQ